MGMTTLDVAAGMAGRRVDQVLAAAFPEYSRAFWQRWINKGHVTLQGKSLKPRSVVHSGEVLKIEEFPRVSVLEGRAAGTRRAARDISIVFEDQDLLVVNKPADLVTHPAPSVKALTLVDWLRDHVGPAGSAAFAEPDRLGVVHRLDKDTTGLLVVAKSPVAQAALSRQFENRTVRKTYAAIVEGVVASDEGTVSAPIGRSKKDRSRMAIVTGGGRPAESRFKVLERAKEATLMHWFPKTGRTHQIRIHAAAIGHPIMGDRAYGAKGVAAVPRPMLHAEALEFQHPGTGRKVVFRAPRPADFRLAWSMLKSAAAVALMGLVAGTLAFAEPSETAKPRPKPSAAKPAAAKPAAESSSTRQLRKEMADLQSQMNALGEQLGQLATALEGLDLANRLRDLEKSVVELNNKAVSAQVTVEESKTQLLDAQRRLKAEQEATETLRDQLDRLQREVIQWRARLEGAASSDGSMKAP